MSDKETRIAVDNKLQECAETLDWIRGIPTVNYDLRGRVAGRALLNRNIIRLNTDLLLSERDEMINVVTPHEFAHIVAYEWYGDNGHGNGWKAVMNNLGLRPDRCHNMEVKPARITKKFDYVCPCGKKYVVGLNVHRKIQRGQNRLCPKCKGLVIYAG